MPLSIRHVLVYAQAWELVKHASCYSHRIQGNRDTVFCGGDAQGAVDTIVK